GPQTDVAARISNLSTNPSVKSIMATIADQENEHNHSYAYVLSSVTNLDKQNESFETGRTDEVLMTRNERILNVYNEFAENPTVENTLKAMVYTSLLEGLFFYSGFAFFYNLARNQKMVGTSTMISYINRDELQHGKAISDIFRAALAENPEYNTEAFTEWAYDQFKHAGEQEIRWREYVIQNIEDIDTEEGAG